MLKKTTLNDLKQLRDTDLVEHKAGSGRPRRAQTNQNINLLVELVLSQEDIPVLQYCNLITSYAGCGYQFLLILKQFS